MASPPYMSVWVADWTADTQHLSCEQDGAYWRLIRALWRAHGVLPNDERKLAHIVGLSVKKWRAIAPDVMAFFEVDQGGVQHEKLTKTLISVAQMSEDRSVAGAKGGRAKALKMHEARLAIASGLPPVLPQQTASISDVKYQTAADATREGDDWPAGKPLDHASLIVSEANTVYLDTAREPGLIQTLGRLHAWRRDGASWQHDILPVITTMAGKLSRPVKSWAYFDAAIGESIAANRRALTIPEHDHVNRPDPARPASGHDSRRRGALEALDLLERGDVGREGDGGPDQG